MLTRPAATSLMPTWAPPWAILNLILLGWVLTYFWASRETRGNDAVAPLIVTRLVAEAAAGAATPSRPATVKATERRRIRSIEEALHSRN